MKKLGRIQKFAVAGLSALALSVPVALAQTAGGEQQGQGPQGERAERRGGKGERGGRRHGRHGRHGGGGGRDFGVRGLRGVELSDAQKASLKQLRQGYRDRTQPVREQLRAKRQELRQAQSGTAFNESLAAQKLTETAGLKARMMAERHRLQQESLAVLTPEQRTQLEQRRQQREQRRQERRAERGARAQTRQQQ
ncbi:MAG TPA: periplasmic heavy metal sensor [Pyrinomonadaceae bacterium]|jgi:protein CpxP